MRALVLAIVLALPGLAFAGNGSSVGGSSGLLLGGEMLSVAPVTDGRAESLISDFNKDISRGLEATIMDKVHGEYLIQFHSLEKGKWVERLRLEEMVVEFGR